MSFQISTTHWPTNYSSITLPNTLEIEVWNLLVIAFRKYITSRGLRTLKNGPETPTQWKSESVSDWLTNLLTGGVDPAISIHMRGFQKQISIDPTTAYWRNIQETGSELVRKIRNTRQHYYSYPGSNVHYSNLFTTWTPVLLTKHLILV